MSFESPDKWRDEDGWRIIGLEEIDGLRTKLVELRRLVELRDIEITQLRVQLNIRTIRISEGAVSGPLVA